MKRRRASWRWILPFLIAAACAAPLPTTSPSPIQTQRPATPTGPVASPSATPTGWTTYDTTDLSFDYPADWRVITEQDIRIGQYTYVVVGTGDWRSGCVGSNCTGSDVFIADPGEVVAHFSYFFSGPARPIYGTPPFDALLLASGLAATITDGPQRTLATIFIPGSREMTVDVRYGSAPSEAQRTTVHEMIESIAALGQLPETLRTADRTPDGPDCASETARGRLVRGDFGGPNLATGDGAWVTSLWPPDWTVRVGEAGRIELFDEHGTCIAREWDEVEAGGRGDANEFRVCRNSVSVVRSFPATTD